MKQVCVLIAVLALLAAPAMAVDKVKIGFITTLTTPAGVIGQANALRADYYS